MPSATTLLRSTVIGMIGNADIGRVYDMLVWRQCGHRHSMLSLVYTEVEGGDGTASLRGG